MTNSVEIDASLQHEDEEVRRQAVESLLERSAKDALPLIVRAMGDESWRVRKTAVEAILTYGDPAPAIEALLVALRSEENAGLRNSSVETLIRMGEPAVPALIAHMNTPNDDVRKFIIDILGGIGDSRAVPALITAMQDPNENVRSAATESLGTIGSEKAVDSLLAAIRRDDLQLRHSALRALASIGQPVPLDAIAPLLEKSLLKKAVYECLGNLRELRAIDLLIEGLGDRTSANRTMAAASLMKIYHSAEEPRFREACVRRIRLRRSAINVEGLVRDLGSSDLDKRISVVQVLGFVGDASATLALLEAAAEESLTAFSLEAIRQIGLLAGKILLAEFFKLQGERRAIACSALGDLGERGAVGALVSAMGDDSPEVRASAATALGKLDALESLFPLTALLEDPCGDVQEAAVKTIVCLSDGHREEILGRVTSLAGAGENFIRANAVRILGGIVAEERIDTIAHASKDEDPIVRRAAFEALARIDFGRFEEAFQLALTDESPEVRQLTAELWGKSGHPRAVENLELMLRDEEIWVQCAAARGLGVCGDASAVGVLRGMIKDAEGLVKITMLEVLVQIAGSEAADQLIGALRDRDPEVIKVALEGLERIDAVKERSPLPDALAILFKHDDPDVRLAAARFAGTQRIRATLPALLDVRERESDMAVKEMMRYAIERLGVSGFADG